MSARAVVEVGPEVVTKRFAAGLAHLAEHEVAMMKQAPWAAPELVAWGEGWVSTRTLPRAVDLPDWRPKAELVVLLKRLHEAGINHRDVHVGNILCHPERGPVLIDWELATTKIKRLSYDLHGPEKSGIRQPQGQRGPAMWVGCTHPMSVGVKWKR